MKNLTERAMAQALSKLLETRTLDKITIRDITDECGLTRNTFYYHFHDVYDLLHFMFKEKTDEIMRQYRIESDWEGGLEATLDFLYQHRRMMIHLDESINDDMVLRFINDVMLRHAKVIVAQQARGQKHSTRAIEIAAELYVNAAVGDVMGWIRRGMDHEPEHLAQVYNTLFLGTVRAVLNSAEEASRIP